MWLVVAEVGVVTSIGGTVPYICVCPVASWSFVLPPRISLLYALPLGNILNGRAGGSSSEKKVAFDLFESENRHHYPALRGGKTKSPRDAPDARWQKDLSAFQRTTNIPPLFFIYWYEYAHRIIVGTCIRSLRFSTLSHCPYQSEFHVSFFFWKECCIGECRPR